MRKSATLLFAAGILLLAFSTSVLAQTYYPYGMMGGGGWMFWMGLVGLIYLAVASFVFSIIFWLTHNWLSTGKK